MSTESVQKLFLAVVLFLVALSFLTVPGTGDMMHWKAWIQSGIDFGPVQGFAENNLDYPPLTALILFAGYRGLSQFGFDQFLTIKLLILLFLVATTLIFWLWTRNYWWTVIFHLALLLNSVLLAYVDVFIGPTVLLALWALQKRRLWAFTLCFSAAVLTKWTPLVLLPFMALYILDVKGLTGWRRINFKGIFLEVLLLAAAIVTLVVLIYGANALHLAFSGAFAQPWLSGDAMNLNWIVTHWLHVHQPAQYGPLVNWKATNVVNVPTEITRWPTLLFWFFYLGTLAAFFWRPKTFENMLQYSLIGFVVYFTFNVGVHENHLFLAIVLACALAWLNKRHWFSAAFWILMFNMNLVLFYGFLGQLDFNRVVGRLDMPLLLSALIVIYTVGMWLGGILPRRNESTGAPHPPAALHSS